MLFPAAPSRAERPTWGRIAVRTSACLAATAVGAVVLVLRIAGRSPLDTIYAEDITVFLPWALAHPWHLMTPYAGYLQLLPRILAQLATYLPLRDAATALAISGAVTSGAVAVFVWHASASHIRSPWLRGLLAAAVLLLSVAPLEIADTGVNTPWYLLLAMFWAALYRPPTRAGMALAALVGLLAAASNPLAIVFAPLLALRIAALRRVREHAVTIGWAAGALLQLPVIRSVHQSRVGQLAPPQRVLSFYLHDVVLRLPGWRISWQLEGALGRNGATVLVGIVLLVLLAAIVATQPARVRILAGAAIGTGFLLAFTAATVSWWVGLNPVLPGNEPGSRYTTLPIFLLQTTLIVAVDAVLTRPQARRQSVPDAGVSGTGVSDTRVPDSWAAGAPVSNAWAPHAEVPDAEVPDAGVADAGVSDGEVLTAGRRARPYAATVAVLALVAGLGAGWVTDFRNSDGRGWAMSWAPVAADWLATCQADPANTSISVNIWEVGYVSIPCPNLRR